jgi:hypothetical protein
MKTRSIIISLVFFLASTVMVLSSCSKEFDWWRLNPDKEGFSAAITLLEAPETIYAGQTAVFSVSYYKPQPCYTRTGVHTKLVGFEMEVEVNLKRDHVYACADVLVGETAEFSVIFPLAGKLFSELQRP